MQVANERMHTLVNVCILRRNLMSIVVEQGTVSRTKKCIIEALFSLMKQYKFDEITVTQIAQEAYIARRTFYLNFNSKNEVLECYIKLLYREYLQIVLVNEVRSFEHDVILFFKFWKSHSEILYLLQKNDKFTILLSEFESILVNTEYFNFSFWLNKGIDKDKRDYIASILSAILWRILERWVKNDMKEPVEELVETFVKVVI